MAECVQKVESMEGRGNKREKEGKRGIHRQKLWQQDIGTEREEKRCDCKNKDQGNIENGKRKYRKWKKENNG